MCKPRVITARFAVALLVAAALCVTATASASAAWYVEGSSLSGTAALAATASVTEHFKLKSGGAGVTIECSANSLNSTNAEIKAPNAVGAASLTFNECKGTESCKLATKAIATGPLVAEATELGYPEGQAVFSPKTKTTLATIKFEGEKCALAGTQAITGKFTTQLPTLQEEKTPQEFKATATEASKELKLGSDSAELTGAATLKLTSGKNWELNRPAPPAPRLEQVNFTNNAEVVIDHREDTTPEKAQKIEEFGAKNNVEWESTVPGEVAKNWPVSFVRETKIVLIARFALEAATRGFLENRLEGEVTLTGEMTVGGTAMVFTKKLTAAQVATQLTEHNTYLTTGEVKSANTLPNIVTYERPTMTWTWTAKETGRANAFRQQMGQSVHNIYITYAAPKETSYLTLLDLDSVGIAEEGAPPSEAKVIGGTWRGFSKIEGELPTVHLRTYKPKSTNGELDREGKAMEYYSKIEPNKTLTELKAIEIFTCSSFGTAGLLEAGEGNCVAWREALKSALAIEGVESTPVRIYVKFGAACAEINECVMLIKNWKFGAAGGAEEFKYKANETIDEEGIAGQSNSNPPPYFNNHALLKAGPNLYDPSYGTGPFNGKEGLKEGEEPSEKSVLKEVQAKAIAGFCEPLLNACQKTPTAQEIVAEPAFVFP